MSSFHVEPHRFLSTQGRQCSLDHTPGLSAISSAMEAGNWSGGSEKRYSMSGFFRSSKRCFRSPSSNAFKGLPAPVTYSEKANPTASPLRPRTSGEERRSSCKCPPVASFDPHRSSKTTERRVSGLDGRRTHGCKSVEMQRERKRRSRKYRALSSLRQPSRRWWRVPKPTEPAQQHLNAGLVKRGPSR